jgi:cation:H+ antiporter
VRHVRHIAHVLRLRLFVLGIVLGTFTTLPELAVGIQAIPQGIVSVSAGNLLGGIMVIFGLVLGLSLILHRKIETDGKLSTLIPPVLFILLPLALASDGALQTIDGVIILCATVVLFIHLYYQDHHTLDTAIAFIHRGAVHASLLWIAGSIALILLASHFIVQLTLNILSAFEISEFVLGMLVFSIGTNLPEFTITFMSWWRKVPDLSISHLVSSAFMNVTALGMLALFAGSVSITAGIGFGILALSLTLILFLFLTFYRSGYALSRLEGVLLVTVYCVFVAGTLVVG